MPTGSSTGSSREGVRIGASDARYHAILDKQFNKRFRARPDYVQIVSSTEQVVAAVEAALREGRRLAVTSGGHCLENFVSDPQVRVILDVSPMSRIYFDSERDAVAIEAGATVGEAFRALFERWGAVVPFGEYPGIGIGGHVAGGAFGFLCRELGLAADYLYAVEVVVVDESGAAQSVVATREAGDPLRELWWAHTGGGAGNFGVVTRYWFRSPDATGSDPRALLPRAPESITTFRAEWSWADLDEAAFLRFTRNHGLWGEQNSGVGAPGTSLWSVIALHRKESGKVVLRGLSTSRDAAEQQITDYLAALGEGGLAASGLEVARLSWLDFALDPFPELFTFPPGGVSVKAKDAMLKKALSERQLRVAYDYLTRRHDNVMGGMLGLASYGGKVNALASDVTASAQRSSIFDIACNTGWLDPRHAANNLDWVRAFYRDLFADSGGVPTPGEAYDGTFINHPDVDLIDPALNSSGVPWHTLYYQANYPRLQRVKARWDPRDVFRHALSVRAG